MSGGSGQPLPKQFLTLRGKPVLQWSIEAFLAVPNMAKIVVVLPFPWLEEGKQRLAQVSSPKLTWAVGGKTRQDSVFSGLEALPPSDCWVAVHDAARPGITTDTISQAFSFAHQHGNAVVALPTVDTLVSAKEGKVTGDIDRQTTFAIQTPQIFPLPLLRQALEKARQENWEATDDAGLVRRLGHETYLFPGSRRFMKLTCPEDLEILEAIL